MPFLQPKLDEKDFRILTLLQKNCRMTAKFLKG
ncbi:MAG: winged helix-turn-helix transcriptional regulator [Candidatus Bathyarchaeia archaeon]